MRKKIPVCIYVREAAKKLFLLIAWPLRGGWGRKAGPKKELFCCFPKYVDFLFKVNVQDKNVMQV